MAAPARPVAASAVINTVFIKYPPNLCDPWVTLHRRPLAQGHNALTVMCAAEMASWLTKRRTPHDDSQNKEIRMFRVIIAALLILPSPAAFAQNAEAGEKIFNKCKACHMVGDDAKNRVGPVLTGVVGRPAGTYEGYRYGTSVVDAGEAGLIWDDDTLFAYLAGPQDFLRSYLDDPKARAKVRFRLKDEQDRRDVIAYLASFSPPKDAAINPGRPKATPLKTAAHKLCVRNLNE